MTERDVERMTRLLADIKDHIIRQNHTIEQQKFTIEYLEAENKRLKEKVGDTE